MGQNQSIARSKTDLSVVLDDMAFDWFCWFGWFNRLMWFYWFCSFAIIIDGYGYVASIINLAHLLPIIANIMLVEIIY